MTRFGLRGNWRSLLLLLVTALAASAPVAAWAEGTAAPPAWEEMSVEQKLEALKNSALELDDDATPALCRHKAPPLP